MCGGGIFNNLYIFLIITYFSMSVLKQLSRDSVQSDKPLSVLPSPQTQTVAGRGAVTAGRSRGMSVNSPTQRRGS